MLPDLTEYDVSVSYDVWAILSPGMARLHTVLLHDASEAQINAQETAQDAGSSQQGETPSTT